MAITNETGIAASVASPIIMDRRESKYRLVRENFLSPDECARLADFTRNYRIVGDGYDGDPHPHIPTETFAGISFSGSFPHTDLPEYQLALRVMQRTRKLMMQHFRVPMLWLDFGHLVSRTVTGASNVPAEEFSHPWHYDNQSEGVKYRSHTAILYINDEFTGGHTCFKEADFGPFREVTPKAGTLVGFKVAENAHAVTKLLSGERFVLNMWFCTYWRKYSAHRQIFKQLKS